MGNVPAADSIPNQIPDEGLPTGQPGFLNGRTITVGGTSRTADTARTDGVARETLETEPDAANPAPSLTDRVSKTLPKGTWDMAERILGVSDEGGPPEGDFEDFELVEEGSGEQPPEPIHARRDFRHGWKGAEEVAGKDKEVAGKDKEVAGKDKEVAKERKEIFGDKIEEVSEHERGVLDLINVR